MSFICEPTQEELPPLDAAMPGWDAVNEAMVAVARAHSTS